MQRREKTKHVDGTENSPLGLLIADEWESARDDGAITDLRPVDPSVRIITEFQFLKLPPHGVAIDEEGVSPSGVQAIPTGHLAA